MEENIHNYLIYLLVAKKDLLDTWPMKKKVWKVLGVIMLTMFVQGWALTVMFTDTEYFSKGKSGVYFTD